MPLVINSLEGGDTHTHTQTYRRWWTEAIIRNQAHQRLASVCLVYKLDACIRALLKIWPHTYNDVYNNIMLINKVTAAYP